MKTVKGLLQKKPAHILSVTPDTPASDAIELMTEADVGALLVVENGRLVGIVSERDFTRELFHHNRSPESTPVGEVMTRRVLYVHPENTLDECMALMTEMRLRHLPVLEGDRVLGMISMRDLVQEVIADKEFMIEQLTKYITDQRA